VRLKPVTSVTSLALKDLTRYTTRYKPVTCVTGLIGKDLGMTFFGNGETRISSSLIAKYLCCYTVPQYPKAPPASALPIGGVRLRRTLINLETSPASVNGSNSAFFLQPFPLKPRKPQRFQSVG